MLAAAVLFVACANVAGLLTSRAPVRAREIALRLAIGAGRPRVIRQLITESVLIAIAGGVLGLGVGYAAVTLFSQIQIPTDLPIVPSFELDRRALLVSLVVALVERRPVRLASGDPVDACGPDRGDEGDRRRGLRPPPAVGRAVLVAGQVAVSVVLLVVATFIYRGFQHQLASGPGFRTDHLLMMSFEPSQLGYSEAQAQQFFEQVAERARLVPGVKSAALTSLHADGRRSSAGHDCSRKAFSFRLGRRAPHRELDRGRTLLRHDRRADSQRTRVPRDRLRLTRPGWRS